MSKNNPTVSVVMPVYNSARYLPLAIESILDQTYSNFEFIIIDDGSTDASWDIISRYSLRDKRIKARRNPSNLGICRTLNQGLSLAKGDYIARMDSDDWSYPDRLSKQLTFMRNHPKVVICGGDIEVCDSNLQVKNHRYYPVPDKKIREKIFRINPFAHPATMYKKQLALEVGGYNEKLSSVEDYDLYFRLGNYGKFANLTDTLLKLRIRHDSISSANTRRQAFLHLYVRVKAITEYGYAWHPMDVVFFIAGLVGIIIVPTKYKLKLYSSLRSKFR